MSPLLSAGVRSLFLFLLFALPLRGQVILTEFLASNDAGRKDVDGQFNDWMELHNAGTTAVNLQNWSLTDKADNKNKWRFPAVSLAAGAYLVVFASEKDRVDPGAELHTNFKLGAGGEYLALVQADGVVATEYAPFFPPQTPDVSYGLTLTDGSYGTEPRYFTTPTPGAANGSGTSDLGPVLSQPAHFPLRPAAGSGITVTVKVTRALAEVAEVKMRWLVMFDSTANVLKDVVMHDDGADGDAVNGDGIFSAVIPGTMMVNEVPTPTYGAGRLIRWYFTATDTSARASRWPLFADPLNSAEFLGTVAQDLPASATTMPVWYWFAKNTSAAGTDTGTRGAVFYRDRLYDNIFIRRRGGATSTNSKKFDFNSGDHCYIDDVVGSVEEANINISSQDSTLIRPPLAFEAFRTSGHPACASFPIMLRTANATSTPGSTSITNLISYFCEQPDERFLERWGLDPEGALYKMNQMGSADPVFSSSTDGVEKRTRQTEPNTDLEAVCTALKKRTTAALREERSVFMFDHFDLANMVNYLAIRAVINDYDDVRKNFYLYRDTRGSGEWLLLPWDKDGTFGVTGDGGTWLPHPFFGDLAHLKQGSNQWNLLWEAIFNDPLTQAMYLRRLRSVMDAQLQPVSVPAAERYMEKRADAWAALFTPARSAQSIRNFLSLRRSQLYTTYSVSAGTTANRLIPAAQDAAPVIGFGAVETNPADGNPGAEYLEILNPNPAAVDVSGWTISGGIDHTFLPGTVIRASDKMILTHTAPAFRARTTGPRGGQKLFVQGGWSGSLSARGETLILKDLTGRVVATMATPSAPTPAQESLRVSKIMYAPAAGGEFEYLELVNIGAGSLDLAGVTFDKGITFTFPAGAMLAPGARLLLVKNLDAFTALYGVGLPVGGVYTGSLDNSGERLRLVDAVGEEVLDFTYAPAWVPAANGGGAALVVENEKAPWTAWDTATGWRASTSPNGSPGNVDPAPPALPVLALTGNSTLRITAAPGTIWIVQRSTGLTTWLSVGSVTADEEGHGQFVDPAPLVGGRVFYRCSRP